MKTIKVFTLVLLAVVFCIQQANATNIATGATVTLNGTFFNGGWAGAIPGNPQSLTDGVFLPQSWEWDNYTVYWNEWLNTSGTPASIEINLGGPFRIDSFVVQVDDNDAYKLFYWNENASVWSLAWDVPNYDYYQGQDLWGLQTRPDPTNNNIVYLLPSPIETTKLLLMGNDSSSDRLYGVSEIQAYGTPVNETSAMLLLGSYLVVMVIYRRSSRMK